MHAAKALASLRIFADSPEPSLLADTISSKSRSLVVIAKIGGTRECRYEGQSKITEPYLAAF